MDKKLNKIVGKQIKYLRRKKGYSQEKFANICNLHRTYIGGIERGERNITLNTLQIIADALEINPGELLIDLNENV